MVKPVRGVNADMGGRPDDGNFHPKMSVMRSLVGSCILNKIVYFFRCCLDFTQITTNVYVTMVKIRILFFFKKIIC
jgi:hypothetical protein